MGNRGLLYIAFGESYQELAVWTIAHTRKFTDLPIVVLINGTPNSKWEGLENVTVHHFDLPQTEKQNIRTQMCRYTPFQQTLYLDCDSAVRCPGIEMIFDMLGSHDILLNEYLRWEKLGQVSSSYCDVMKTAGVTLPISIYSKSLIAWNSNHTSERFFKTWNQMWKKIGCGLGMPVLACAVKKMEIDVMDIASTGMFEPELYDPACLIQHNYSPVGKMNFFDEFKLPRVYQEGLCNERA